MKNRQYLTIKQVKRLTDAGVNLSGASALWLKLEQENPLAVSKEFAQFFFLKDTIEENTIAPAPTLSDLMSILPASILTGNNLRYFLTLQAAMTKDGVRFKAGYILQPSEGIEKQQDLAGILYCTCKHDNPLDAVYELVMSFISDDATNLLNSLQNGDNA